MPDSIQYPPSHSHCLTRMVPTCGGFGDDADQFESCPRYPADDRVRGWPMQFAHRQNLVAHHQVAVSSTSAPHAACLADQHTGQNHQPMACVLCAETELHVFAVEEGLFVEPAELLEERPIDCEACSVSPGRR